MQQYAIWERGTHLLDRRTRLARVQGRNGDGQERRHAVVERDCRYAGKRVAVVLLW